MRIRTCQLAVTLFTLSLASPALAQLPPNVQVPSVYRGFVESIADRSATFRRQLQRIEAAPRLTITIDVVPHIVGARATTRMVRRADELTADIEIARFQDIVELVAHEIEHVVEQLDRIDLAAGADMADAGIHVVAGDGMTFETDRAIRVGLLVAQEVRDWGRGSS